MRIMIVCGAGASSTFVAGRLQRAAVSSGISLTARAGTWGGLSGQEDVDLVLIGSHLAEQLEATQTLMSPIRVAVLPDSCVRDLSGRETLALVTGGAANDG